MLSVQGTINLIIMVVIFLALSFGLVNTLVMAVFERVREIGLMLALGMTPRDVLSQIVAESILLLVIGLAIGNLAAFALGALVGAIQALRLEYYEGFVRFFSGNGRAYRPLRLHACAPGTADT